MAAPSIPGSQLSASCPPRDDCRRPRCFLGLNIRPADCPACRESRMRFGSVQIVEGEGAMEAKPTIKLTWRKTLLIMTLCVGAVFDRAGHTYHQKGHLDSADLWVAAISIV